jgi:hypothetical protein
MRLGIAVLLFVWALWDVMVDTRVRPGADALIYDLYDFALPMYRSVGCMILLGWCYGVNLWVWHTFRINFAFIFELDTRTAMHYADVFQAATSMTILFEANFIVYFKVLRGDFPSWIPAGYYPVSLFVWFLCKSVWQLKGSVFLRV